MVSALALTGISTAFGLIQSLTKRSEKAEPSQARQANFAEEARQVMPGGKPGIDADALFAALDADKSGSVSKEEFSGALAKLKESAKDSAGAFSRETWGALLAAQEQSQKGKSSSGLMDRVFARFDADGDGQISQEELLKGLPPGRMKEARKDGLEALFNSMDRDGDGRVTLDEMKIALQSMKDERKRDRDGGGTLTGADVAAASTQPATTASAVTNAASA